MRSIIGAPAPAFIDKINIQKKWDREEGPTVKKQKSSWVNVGSGQNDIMVDWDLKIANLVLSLLKREMVEMATSVRRNT